MTPQGELVQDFHILARDHALHILNAPALPPPPTWLSACTRG
jgi:hypothetical protein